MLRQRRYPNDSLLGILRAYLRSKITVVWKLTVLSTVYRKRAARIARDADVCEEPIKELELIKRALEWIALAENEELLAEHGCAITNLTGNESPPMSN